MKKILLFTIVGALMISFSTLQAADPVKVKKDKKESVKVNKEQKLSETEIQVLVTRIEEINNMDKSTLTAREKRDLRKEVRDIKDKVNKNAEGIYIGGGVLLVVIIVLLVLLL